MPAMNLRRVERAAARAAQALGRKPPAELVGLADRWQSGPSRDRWTEVSLAGRELEQLLARAVELERNARDAQEAAVEALRYIGGRSPSWSELGKLLGLSGQGAHRRYRHVEDPEPQRTIDDELEARA